AVAKGLPAGRRGGGGRAGCARTGRACHMGSFPQAAGAAGCTGGLATAMTTQGPERPGGPAPFPPARGDPGPATDKGPVEPGTEGTRDPGPAAMDKGPVEPGTEGTRDPGPAAMDKGPVEPGAARARDPGP